MAALSGLVLCLAFHTIKAQEAGGRVTPLPRLRLEPDRAMTDAPLQVRLDNPPAGAVVRFTTNGSEPTALNGQTYAGPWTLDRTTLLRVAAFANGKAVSRTSTHTYLFLQSVLNQPSKPKGFPSGGSAWQGESSHYGMDARVVRDPRYASGMKSALQALPSLSVVCAPEDLFGEETGLYLNSLSRGASWEKACSLEWIETNGTGAFQIDCGLRMQGNTGRRADKTPKHSFRLLFKERYGETKLRHRVFPDSPVAKFDTLVLRADYNNAWTHWLPEDNARAQRTRDSWLKDTHRDMGWTAAHSRPVHLYLNGLYWGIYDVAERPDASFAAAYLGGDKEDYDVLDDSGVKSGDPGVFADRPGRARRREPLTFEQAGNQVDRVEFIDYVLLNYYAGNQDWGEYQNWYLIRRRKGPEPFRYYVWDGEITLQSLGDDVVNAPRRPSLLLARRLSEDPEYRLAFADRVQKHCFGRGALTPAASIERWMRRADVLKVAILAESARWGYVRRDPPFNRDDDWQAEQRRLVKDYFPRRTQVLLRQLRKAGLYPQVAAPSVAREVVGGETVVSLSAPEGATLYVTTDGTDPRTSGTGRPAPRAAIYQSTVRITSSAPLKARVLLGDTWSALVEETAGPTR